MKTLQISKQDAVKLYVKASPEIKVIFENTFGKESFSNKITDRIQSFDDVLECLNINDLLLPFRNPITQEEKSINAMLKLLKIVEAYNEGTVLNWKDTSQYKHWPYKYCSGGGWSVLPRLGLRCFLPCGAHF